MAAARSSTPCATETGRVMIQPPAGATPPSRRPDPAPARHRRIVDSVGRKASAWMKGGMPCVAPGRDMMRTVHGIPKRFRKSYWEHISGACRRCILPVTAPS